MGQEDVSRWSLSHTGNRVLACVFVAWLVWFVSQSVAAGAVVGVVLFLLLTVLIKRR